MDTVSLRVASKLIRDFSIFSVSKVLRSSPWARCSTVASKIYQFTDVLALRLFRWTMYCVMLFSLLSSCSVIGPCGCWVSAIKLRTELFVCRYLAFQKQYFTRRHVSACVLSQDMLAGFCWRWNSNTHLPDGYPQDTRIQYPSGGIGTHLAHELEFGAPPNCVVLDFFPVTDITSFRT
jgi:hypothetical protein